MLEMIRNVASRLLGILAGALTGIGAGFIPGYHFILAEHNPDVTSNLMYLFSLPFFILWHVGRGAFEGASKGLIAGLIYPKTVNDGFLTLGDTVQLNNKLRNYLARSSIKSPLLTEEEQQEFEIILNKEQIKERKDFLSSIYEHYQQFVREQKCAITGKALKDLRKPMLVEVNNQVLLCEASALLNRVEECYMQEIPVTISENHSNIKHIVRAENVYPLTMETINEKIANFITKVKNYLSPVLSIYQTLVVPNKTTATIQVNPRNEQPIINIENKVMVKNSTCMPDSAIKTEENAEISTNIGMAYT